MQQADHEGEKSNWDKEELWYRTQQYTKAYRQTREVRRRRVTKSPQL